MDLTDKTEKKEVDFGKGPRTVTVVVTPLTEEEAMEMFPYRPKGKYNKSRFGGDQGVDDVALLLSKLAQRCGMCTAPTRKEYLVEGACPDCDGRSEYNGTDPREQVT